MQLPNNSLVLSVAGSGKTTYLVKEALKVAGSEVLITTYTEANEKEIRRKFMELNRSIPANITIQTWFSFLIQHGVKPYQGVIFSEEIKGMILVNGASGIRFVRDDGVGIPFTEKNNFKEHYFTSGNRIFSDKLSKFVVRCNKESRGSVINRLTRIYSHLFIDEVQDLAGSDLEFLKLLFKSKTKVILVGDPRQVTYLTHNSRLNSKYQEGNIKQFIIDKCSKDCDIDEVTLKSSHRNNAEICSFASRLYPNLSVSEPCECKECRSFVSDHNGVFLIKQEDVDRYKAKFKPTVLRYQLAEEPEWNYGNCKGLGFDRVLIYPSEPIKKYLRDGLLHKIVKGKTQNAFDLAKYYVAITRARYSVGIVYNYEDKEAFIEGVRLWKSN